MRLNRSRLSLALSIFVTLLAGTVAHAQNDVALSVFGAFNSQTTYNLGFEHQDAADAVGALFEFRHIRSPLIGYEVTYSFSHANQVYSYAGVTPVGTLPGSFSTPVATDAHQITGDWIFSFPAGKFRPFALAGMGVLINRPVSGQGETTISTEPVYVYGAGLDWKLVPHIGLRFQYRGNINRAPNITPAFGSNGGFTHTAEPMVGAYFKF